MKSEVDNVSIYELSFLQLLFSKVGPQQNSVIEVLFQTDLRYRTSVFVRLPYPKANFSPPIKQVPHFPSSLGSGSGKYLRGSIPIPPTPRCKGTVLQPGLQPSLPMPGSKSNRKIRRSAVSSQALHLHPLGRKPLDLEIHLGSTGAPYNPPPHFFSHCLTPFHRLSFTTGSGCVRYLNSNPYQAKAGYFYKLGYILNETGSAQIM